jgi:voltage-gated potassium channel Kch
MLAAIWALIVIFGAAAVSLAVWGWTRELPHVPEKSDFPALDIAMRSVKVLLLSDIYYEKTTDEFAGVLLEAARAFGIIFSVLLALRLLLLAIGSRLAEFFFRLLVRKHDLIIGEGPAAVEYAASHATLFNRSRSGIHLAAERLPTSARFATLVRRGTLKAQLRTGAAGRARRIVIDEGNDADTWETAQAVARVCPRAEVLAHITDPWIRERLSREQPTFGLAAFSYAAGAARQVMLAHPPYLLARNYQAKAQHILVVGFGQVGQSLAREFIVSSVVPDIEPMMVTVVDPDANRLSTDFRGRHPDLGGHIDFEFIAGDFRLTDQQLFDRVFARRKTAEICAVYVAIDDGSHPLSLALAMRAAAAQAEIFRAPIFVCAQHGAGLPGVRHGPGLAGAAPDERKTIEERAGVESLLCDLRVTSFGAWEEAFDGAGLLEPEFDGQAKLFHREYTRLAVEQGNHDPKTPPSSAPPWEALPDQLRISNRRAAAHVRAKAHAAGYPLTTWLESSQTGWRAHDLPAAADSFAVGNKEFMLRMAKLEHRRWMLDRFLDGWRLGPRDDYARRRADLVPFEELTEASVDKDRTVILTAVSILKSQGKELKKKRR